MKKGLLLVLTLFMSIVGYAYDIAVENEDGVTIYYNYINDTEELAVAGFDMFINENSGILNIPEEVTYMGRTRKVTEIMEYACQRKGDLISVTIPNSVTRIGSFAFWDSNRLTSITIPNSVREIGYHAFWGCESLKQIEIPNSVTRIEEGLFRDCISLSSLSIPNSVVSIESLAFTNCSSLTSVTIPNSVREIGWSAFEKCISLTSVDIPYSVNKISSKLFYGCKALTSVTIPNSVTSIEELAFGYCSSLTSVTIPNSVTSIGNGAFEGCSSLTSVTIPNSVTSIGGKAFYDCPSLNPVISKMENPCNIYSNCFLNDIFYNITLYVPKGTIDKYRLTDYWSKFKYFEEGDPSSGETPESKKCSKPTISYNKGQLTFNCQTDGVSYHYSITDSDIKSGSSSKVDLTVTYNISIFATKTGYEDSETAYATLCWIDVDPKTDGITNGVTQVKAQPVLIQAQDGFINITGVNEGQHIAVYQVDGKQVASANAYDGTANIVTTLSSGTIAIVKIGNKAVKVMMQ